MLGKGSSNKIKPLSNNTVSKLIDEMAADVESKLIKYMREGKFAWQIDDSTVTDNKAIVLAYIFKLVKDYFEEKEIPLTNVSACATYGAPAMSGRHTGLLEHLKKEVPEVITIDCVIHRQHLAAKS
ncbi:zinc finger MYM-type protein 6-like [Parasteatoda tepidariorum]|uniref:zinc finger MYM-type protein 6-like n=1 Tax=Parasteatoda tepidariorum TaxID=114398 RepID=UPI001C7262EA|nr:zinc finger MYM-type protein 6-like [Parasteatoda tepidariorum]